MRLDEELFALEVFFLAGAVREAVVERDLLDGDKDVFFTDVLLDEALAPPAFLAEDFAPPELLPDVAFAAPDVLLAVERLEAEDRDLALPEVFPLAIDREAVAFFAVDLAPPDDFLLEPPDVLRPEVLLVPDDLLLAADDVFFAVELLEAAGFFAVVFFAAGFFAAGFFAAGFFAVDFDLDDELLPDEVFEAVFFVVAIVYPPGFKKMLRNEFSKNRYCARNILGDLPCEGTEIG